MKKIDILKDITFGNQIAEEEKDTLTQYFVETNSWKKIIEGDVDIVYGPKGSGKSAIYLLIQAHDAQLQEHGIILAPAENVRGAPAFATLVGDPPATEREFISLWKLYFLGIIGNKISELKLKNKHAKEFLKHLEDAGLFLPKSGFSVILRAAKDYVKKYANPKAIEGGVAVDTTSGNISTLTGKIVFEEPTPEARIKGFISVSDLFQKATDALTTSNRSIWLILDRLDVAFDETAELERNALRALFKSYRDLRQYDNINLKIFLRSDIWKRVSEKGFREASHISRDININWDRSSLQNLIIRRLLNNDAIVKHYNINKKRAMNDSAIQEEIFNKVFPNQIERGEKQSKTMDWLLKRLTDGTGQTTPRELILFLNEICNIQAARLERGEKEPVGTALFDATTFKYSLAKVSEYRVTRVLYSEYPDLRKYFEALERQKCEHDLESLSNIWNLDLSEAEIVANTLINVGFFERRTVHGKQTYWTPFVYRPYLKLVQGKQLQAA